VFKPIFTICDVGEGLALSVSDSIIQQQGSTLRVSREWGMWTEFSFDLRLTSPQE
jgi:C4-dicarboxylate-specific signal transduction histidine kinase